MTQTNSTPSNDKGFYIFAACAIATLLIVAFINLYQARKAAPHLKELSYSQFLQDLDQGQVRSVIAAGPKITGLLLDNSAFRTYAADDPDLIRLLRQKGVAITAVPPPASAPSMGTILTSTLPLLILVVISIYFLRQSGGGARGRSLALGKSKAKQLTRSPDRLTFADVAGVDEARDRLQEIVEFLRDPRQFEHLGGRIPRGVLLVGPPGTGKTLLARAVAGEAEVPFFTISGSDFVEMFVGVGASRVRDMFEQAKKSAPCIIFVDEIDAVGRR